MLWFPWILSGLLAVALAVAGERWHAWRRAALEYRARLGRGRTPALTRVLPALAPRAPDHLPRFRLTALDGRVDPDGVWRPPPLP